ncbi:MAG TPA: hypothetical protein VNX18_00355 [Bryobacteraceae bacterium]|jgi:hypothetical protein|nr:hypothetical protein [Bryobacteraceae bacterium]
MELGPYQLQIFAIIIAVLVALVALICDVLKRNNEQLREELIELKVRREEEQKWAQASEPKTEETPTLRTMSGPAEPKRAPSPDAIAVMQRGAQLAGASRAKTAERAPERPVESRR